MFENSLHSLQGWLLFQYDIPEYHNFTFTENPKDRALYHYYDRLY